MLEAIPAMSIIGSVEAPANWATSAVRAGLRKRIVIGSWLSKLVGTLARFCLP